MATDIYWKKVLKEYENILLAYQLFEDKKPIMEYRLPGGIIMAFPAEDYINSLTLRTRENTRQVYEKISCENKMMVFVRDMKKEILKSYIVDIESDLLS